MIVVFLKAVFDWKTKVNTLTNHKDTNNAISQSELEVDRCNRRQARENAYKQVAIGLGFTSDWSRK